ncbi:MAG TPA: ABC transporter substrate-binding protein, partial [Propionibacteriaceae bacterium]|nr:ABC transporter substrate-binding protein [Propionibacteriaceae bacterium]
MSDSVFSTPSRRSLFKLGGVVAGGLALAACSKKGGTTGGASGGSAGTLPGIGNNGQVGKGRTQNADTLFIAGFQWGPPTTYNPFSPTAAWPASSNVMQIVYESLLRWNILTGEILPGLAKSYKVDGTSTITLTMQDGITFNDGSPCTAKDAAFSFNIGKTASGVSVASFFQAADSIDATDDKTLVVKVSQKTKNVGQVLRLLTETYIVPQKVFSSLAADKVATEIMTNPVGTGPFKVDTADQTQVVLTQTGSYWGKTFYGGLPVMQKIIHPIFKGNEDANLQFANGGLDVCQTFQ